MATKAQVMGGLTILAKYASDDDTEFLRVDHDQVWCGTHGCDMDPADFAELERLGWFVDSDSWSRFV